MMYLRTMYGIRNRVRNSLIRERCVCELSELEKIERNVVKLFGNVERMREERLVKRVYRAMWRVTGGEGGHIENVCLCVCVCEYLFVCSQMIN